MLGGLKSGKNLIMATIIKALITTVDNSTTP
jgi:hypothetical protein